jgi:hypothetical protein
MTKVIYFFCLLKMILLANVIKGQTVIQNDTSIFTIVPNMPTFGQSQEDLQLFIKKESKIPTSLKRTDNTRNVFVRIIIDTTGKVNFDRIMKSPNDSLSAEAKRVTEHMPNWTAGTLTNGRRVKVYYNFPFWFE